MFPIKRLGKGHWEAYSPYGSIAVLPTFWDAVRYSLGVM